MRVKLAGLISIFSVALALGLGVTGELNEQAEGTTTGHVVLAEDKGPHAPVPAPSPRR
ncbi:hypothetical protein ACFWUZ_18695 [Streptomyces sp. NPDC058646]|uniref:hypothetical protein n=1 Tax=Streptomyces sp. NPDC058646 TaxID=3346574 RepID=UPI003655C958